MQKVAAAAAAAAKLAAAAAGRMQAAEVVAVRSCIELELIHSQREEQQEAAGRTEEQKPACMEGLTLDLGRNRGELQLMREAARILQLKNLEVVVRRAHPRALEVHTQESREAEVEHMKLHTLAHNRLGQHSLEHLHTNLAHNLTGPMAMSVEER